MKSKVDTGHVEYQGVHNFKLFYFFFIAIEHKKKPFVSSQHLLDRGFIESLVDLLTSKTGLL